MAAPRPVGTLLARGEEPSAEDVLEPKWNFLGQASKWSLQEKLWKMSAVARMGKNLMSK